VNPVPSKFFDLPTFLFVVALPLLVVGVTHSPKAVWDALASGFTNRLEDRPREARLASAALLRSLGAVSLSAGMVGLFGAVLAMFHTIAVTGGQGNPAEVVWRLGSLMLSPLYALAVKAFLYDPLAARIEGLAESRGEVFEECG